MTQVSIPDVRFRQGCVVLFLILLVIAAIVFTIAAIDREVLLALSEQRRAGWLSWLTIFEIGGINAAVALLVLYALYEISKFGWQLAQPMAVGVRGKSICFHPTLRQKPVAMADILSAEHMTPQLKSLLKIETRTRGSIVIGQVDEVSAKAFADAINAASSEASPLD